MTSNDSSPLLMVGWDAAEPSLVERWIEDGSLPNLAELRQRGCYGRLESTAEWFAGSVWPTFYTSTLTADHGIYHFLQWRADQMQHARPANDWLPVLPFWRTLGPRRRVVAIDLPNTYTPEPFEGVEIAGWAAHDRLTTPNSHPPSLIDWIRRKLGPPPNCGEPYGILPPKALLQLRDQLNAVTKYVADLAVAMIRREPADCYITAFSSTHTGGHKFWDLSGVRGTPSPTKQDELASALRDIYIAADTALGRLLEAVGESARVLVFSLHGMGPNESRADLLTSMLSRILDADAPQQRMKLLKRLRELVPVQLRHKVKQKLPDRLQDFLTTFWRVGGTEWSKTRVIPLCADLQGYIGINVKGREKEGIVDPGEEYESLCSRISDGLRTFHDTDTGEPIVLEIKRGTDFISASVENSKLPDLLVRWVPTPSAQHQSVHSTQFGTIPWPTPGKSPDGRSGNHRGEGFLVAAGEDIPKGTVQHAHILDLAPTACALLGVEPPSTMRGKPLFASKPL